MSKKPDPIPNDPPQLPPGVSDVKICCAMLQGTCATAFKLGISKDSIIAALDELSDTWKRWGQ